MASERIKARTARFEGRRNVMYTDTNGIPTIGVGHNLTVPISDEAVDLIFAQDLMDVEVRLVQALPWAVLLPEPWYAVLVDMAFNLGVGGLLRFEKMLAALKAGDGARARTEVLASAYASQVGPRAIENANLLESGAWP